MSRLNKKPLITVLTPKQCRDYDPKDGAKYGWIITEDHIHGRQKSDVGTIGPSNCSGEIEELLVSKLDQSSEESLWGMNKFKMLDGNGIWGMNKFKMLDGNGELYYVGWIAGEYDLTEPLDDFGTPNAGAIYLKVLEPDGSWSSAVEAE